MRTLNDKQLAFCAEYVANGYNGAAAYKVAYKEDNDDTAKSAAWAMVRKPNIQEGIKNAELDYRIEGHGLGINKKAILKVIKRSLEATKDIYKNNNKEGTVELVGSSPDYAAQLKAIEVYAKLTGDFSAEKKSLTIENEAGEVDLTKLTKEEREAYKAKILAEL